jgi:hypothetical protein
MSKNEYSKERLANEIKETYKTKISLRREAPLIGFLSFSIALWGSKLFTANSPGSSLVFQLWGYNIHLHHFNYGFVLLVIGLILTFFEGPWYARVQHALFGAGLGFIIDEYWLLLTFDESASTYFGPQSQTISITLAIVVSIIYAIIAVGVFFKSRGERKLWRRLYEAAKSGKLDVTD